jgi:hypothetical protein
MKPTDASNYVNTIRKIKNETRCMLTLLHHLRKPKRGREVHPDDLYGEIKGPTEYQDAAGTVLLLNKISHA